MALRGRNEQIEHIERLFKNPEKPWRFHKPKAGTRKWLKNVRNRLIRRNKNFEVNPKLNEFNGWEF